MNVSAEITLERDDDGQITSATVDAPLEAQPAPGMLPLSYDTAHQVENATYDDLGRLLADRLRQYRWDGNSTLTGYNGQDGSAEFTYDGLGNRISRTTASGSETYVLNHAHALPTVSIVRSAGADQRYYVYEPNGMLLYSIESAGNSPRFYHFDQVGSTMMLTDASGAMTDAYAVTPFGEEVRHQGGSDQPFVYHGAFGVTWEPGTTLYNMRRRYYDAATARFLSRDPVLLLDPLGVNPYQFAFNQPLRFVDPSSLNPFFTDGAGSGPGAPPRNQLWGDWFILDSPTNFAQGDNLVRIEADAPGGLGDLNPNLGGVNSSNPTGYTFYGRYVQTGGGQENREPLGTSWAARYLNGGAFDGGTKFAVWRDSTMDPKPQDTTRRDDSPGSVAAVPESPATGCRLDSPCTFQVDADWGAPGNNILGGSNLCVNPALADTGDFFFFSSDNMEFLIKVLDGVNGTNAFGNFWVFDAATTNVEYTLRVTDTATGATKTYGDPLGSSFPAVTDTQDVMRRFALRRR